LNKDFIARHWYADVYEQLVQDLYEVDFLLNVLREQTDGTPLNILEAACGGGRICVPLAEAGHNVTGFDIDEHMLLKCVKRLKGLPNLSIYQADGMEDDWGSGFDVVVLAGNILMNIESDKDYAEAQKKFIQKSADALRPGGHVYLDFDLHVNLRDTFGSLDDSCYFNGTDDFGTSGKLLYTGNICDPVTRINCRIGHRDLMFGNGERYVKPYTSYKHIPSQEQVYSWLSSAGLVIEKTYKNFSDEPIENPLQSHCRATIWARKGE
jgi:SAM-dependent methyltransferase